MNSFPHKKQLSTSAGDLINIKDLIISTSTGPAIGNSEAQTAAATVVDSTLIGACAKRESRKRSRILASYHIYQHAMKQMA